MGLFQRFRRVLSAQLNHLLSKAEQPEKMLNQLILDMNRQLLDVKKSVASAIADEKRLERQLNTYIDQANEWERKAILAVREQRDDLAKEALLRKQEIEGQILQLKNLLVSQHEAVEKLKLSLRELQKKSGRSPTAEEYPHCPGQAGRNGKTDAGNDGGYQR